jgi:hypothetical protein
MQNEGLLKTVEDRRRAFNAANASNELEGFFLSAEDRLQFEEMIEGNLTTSELLAKFRKEDGLN